MKPWKEAFWLAMYEMRRARLIDYLKWVGLFILLLLMMVPMTSSYLQEPSIITDLYFLFLITIFSQWARGKIFRPQSFGSGWYGSRYVAILNQLPIKSHIIIKSRFLAYFFTSIPFQVLLLLALYLLTPALRDDMAFGSYVIFMVILFCFNVFIGGLQIIGEIGSHLVMNIIISLLVGIFFSVLLSIVFYKVYTQDIVNWILFISKNFPVLALIMSFLLAVIGTAFLLRRLERRMANMDYF